MPLRQQDAPCCWCGARELASVVKLEAVISGALLVTLEQKVFAIGSPEAIVDAVLDGLVVDAVGFIPIALFLLEDRAAA
eukprot:CAMPEP_0181171988 /NCGR_PEP_ID=MMETSP1096-20121128/2211_1 /TAXON_ID=156174 ORGANISM="Chrysochromulina ericina, Strain CCMP281" /NCGR_SAMPLE_ID=MMETSP1096 /ASSEMBLY_ACC=CAM_ASM_000453 /LENGTH=78 /DNA_ID=CAMNT_0023259689 /DNA_START=835 /DNA_END=1068 /DNA_ORIENTATION=+